MCVGLRFHTSDPDIATIMRRVEREIIDLQPDFQRGEVWSTPKKQRLIDTILRGWHVPPIHLVAKGGGCFDVLDGQQRLTAIRDFMRGMFAVDGFIEPIEVELGQLNGLRFGQLPEPIKNEFEGFAIRVFELQDYTPDEPHELFFRLNQPVALTEAEKRNAFIGPARNQVKDLAEWGLSKGMTQARLGFSNARMAYHDLLARFLLTIEQGKLTDKITSVRVTARYRDKEPFADDVMQVARDSLECFLTIPYLGHDKHAKPNKATIHTWLCMLAKMVNEDRLEDLYDTFSGTVAFVENWRVTREGPLNLERSLNVFQDRATARVADVSSVLLRDLVGWLMVCARRAEFDRLPDFADSLDQVWIDVVRTQDPERFLNQYTISSRWGDTGWL